MKKYKIIEQEFFGGKIVIETDLSLEEAREKAKRWNKETDAHTSYYILENDVPDDKIYDYDLRIPVYE